MHVEIDRDTAHMLDGRFTSRCPFSLQDELGYILAAFLSAKAEIFLKRKSPYCRILNP
jgi:hypothetical protein